MNQDDILRATLRRYDPAEIGYERLEQLEACILNQTLSMSQNLVFAGDFIPFSRTSVVRWFGMACLMLFLGAWAGQNYAQVQSHSAEPDLASLTLSMPWQELALN